MKNSTSRRKFIKNTALFSATTWAAPSIIANVLPTNDMPNKNVVLKEFALPSLPYNHDALEPYIDKLTMEIHHGKHHQAYINNLNKAIVAEGLEIEASDKGLLGIFEYQSKYPDVIRNNAGGHYNHSLFWNLMTPKSSKIPTGKLADAILTTFGSFENFQKLFAEAATKKFGSGWAWLIVSDGKLQITTTANQDNPLMKLPEIKQNGTPILALDVWEHAYYLKNQNRRVEYINSWWQVVNWDYADMLFKNKQK
jgi:superoxide dismutase, Fe-Mn family